MRRRWIRRAAAAMAAVLLVSGIFASANAEGTKKPSIRDQLLAQREAEDMSDVKHEVVVYFAGWHLGEENASLGGGTSVGTDKLC